MGAAGIIAKHAAETAMIVRGGVGRVCQIVGLPALTTSSQIVPGSTRASRSMFELDDVV